MRKEKIFSWPKIGGGLTPLHSDVFTDEDQFLNYLIVKDIAVEHEGKTIRLAISNRIKTRYIIYSGVVKNGMCEFLIDKRSLTSANASFTARIVDGDQVASSCTSQFCVCQINLRGNATLPEKETLDIETLLKELDAAILAAGVKLDELKISTANAEVVDGKLKLTIQEANGVNTTLTTTISDANSILGNLSVTITDAQTMFDKLNASIAIADDKIANIKAEGDKQVGLVSAEGAKNVQAITSEGAKYMDSITSEGSKQVASITSEGEKQFNLVSNKGAEIITEANSKLSAITSEGTKQVGLVNDAGAHNVRITEEAGSQVGAAIEQITNRSIANLVAEGNTQVAAVSAEGTKQTEAVTEEGVKQANLVTAEGTKQTGIVSGKGNEIVATADAKIAEINELGQQGFNIRTQMKFYTWLGNRAQFDAIFLKPNNTQYSIYNASSTLINQYFINVNPATYYDKRISLVVQGGKNGIEMFNRSTDPMSIKTLNNNGLKVYEENEDYIIQIDKDAVVTVVENYVVGTFDIYRERLADVEGSTELLALHKITWDANIDNAKLLLDVNKEQLERLANIPSFLPESERPVLETRAIPTNYECCVRTDKKTGEMYIGEGYENFVSPQYLTSANTDYTITYNSTTDVYTATKKYPNSKYSLLRPKLGADDGKGAYSCIELLSNSGVAASWYVSGTLGTLQIGKNKRVFTNVQVVSESNKYLGIGGDMVGEQVVSFKNFMVTNVEAEKPFVKTVMPNGKLSFVTTATSVTHSFVMKGLSYKTDSYYVVYSCTDQFSDHLYSYNKTLDYAYRSRDVLSDGGGDDVSFKGITTGVLEVGKFKNLYNTCINSFKQLLIYKGNLTEAELKAENKKNVKVNLAEVR